MEDKWFAYYEEPRLYLHRSWTGFLIYRVRFEPEGEGGRAVELEVNEDRGQYRPPSLDDEPGKAEGLVDCLLAFNGMTAPPAGRAEDADPESLDLAQWSSVGRAMIGGGPLPGFDTDLEIDDGMRIVDSAEPTGRRSSSRFTGALLGLACGDALGAPAEFIGSREEMQRRFGHLTEMVGGGGHGWAPGEWTDDTGMALCVADGILEAPEDPVGTVGSRFLHWRQTAKDVGGTIREALDGFRGDWPAAARGTSQVAKGRAAGNGSLMRTLPVALAYPRRDEMLRQSARVSAMTHWDPQAEVCCALYCLWIREILAGRDLAEAWEEALRQGREAAATGRLSPDSVGPAPLPDVFWRRLESIRERRYEDLQPSGYAGYSVECLEAAVWCSLEHGEPEPTLISVVNLAGETDTMAAVAGGACGAAFGVEALPDRWLAVLFERKWIEALGRGLAGLRHERIYATPNLPPFEVHEAFPGVLYGRNPLTGQDVDELMDRGVTHVLDLREDHEWRAPGRFGAEAVAALDFCGIERVVVEVRDGGAPGPDELDRAWRAIGEALAGEASKAFVHCRAGRERTGAVVVAYLAKREGLGYDGALGKLHQEGCQLHPLPGQEEAVRQWLGR
jgi:ADP-ribosyl-[dinitrogen reductase] hydrolase